MACFQVVPEADVGKNSSMRVVVEIFFVSVFEVWL